MNFDWMEIVGLVGFVAYGAYEYGVNKPKRDREKRENQAFAKAWHERDAAGKSAKRPVNPENKR